MLLYGFCPFLIGSGLSSEITKLYFKNNHFYTHKKIEYFIPSVSYVINVHIYYQQ